MAEDRKEDGKGEGEEEGEEEKGGKRGIGNDVFAGIVPVVVEPK